MNYSTSLAFTLWDANPSVSRPVSENTTVEVEFADGHCAKGPARAFDWARNDIKGCTINRYRIVPEQDEPKSTVLIGKRGRELLAAEVTLINLGYHYEDGETWTPPKVNKPTDAPGLLDAAAGHMRDRAATYDKLEGERSMGKTVEAFNAITGRDLRESEGWLLLAMLKMVRSEQRSDAHRDSIEDNIAYAALYGEARINGR